MSVEVQRYFSWVTASSCVIDGTSFWQTLQRRRVKWCFTVWWEIMVTEHSNLFIDIHVTVAVTQFVPSKSTVPSPLSSASFTIASISFWLMCSPISLFMADRSSSVVISPSPSMSNWPEKQEKKSKEMRFVFMTPQWVSRMGIGEVKYFSVRSECLESVWLSPL